MRLQAGESHGEQRYVSLYGAWDQSHRWGARARARVNQWKVLLFADSGLLDCMGDDTDECQWRDMCSLQQTQKVVYDEHLNSKEDCLLNKSAEHCFSALT